MSAYFTPRLFSFLKELKANNTRDWFAANRARFESDVQAPMLHFIDDLRPRLAAVNRAFVADPRRSGGSMFRIYRDTRFSSDKSPYKTNVAARFVHRAQPKGQMGPTFYLQLEPGESFGGGGIYHPDMPTLTRIRHAIVDDARGWRAVKRLGLAIEGESLTRAPAGFDPQHPFAEDLRRKDLYVLQTFTQREACGADFMDRYIEVCTRIEPLVAFLAKAAGLKV
jgi:uncharacterized protein (TIGR02453 family)